MHFSRSTLLPAALLLATIAGVASAINLGPLDVPATSYLNDSLTDCNTCYGTVTQARCHRVVLGIYLRDLARKTSSIPEASTVTIIDGSLPAIFPRPQNFFQSNLFCRGFSRLIAERAKTLTVLVAPERERYSVEGAADVLQANIAGSTVAADILRVAANGQLSLLGARLKFQRTPLPLAVVRNTIQRIFTLNIWISSNFVTDISRVQLDQVNGNVVEALIPFKPGASF